MKIQLELNELSAIEKEHFAKIDSGPYGQKLSLETANALILTSHENTIDQFKSGYARGLYESHRDYCGQYLVCVDKQFFFGISSMDGYLDDPLMSFQNTEDFITWLSKQSDQSMSMYGKKFANQTINKNRLKLFNKIDSL